MKKILLGLVIAVLSVGIFIPQFLFAQDDINNEEIKKIEYILFYSKTCPHCHDEIDFINKKILPEYGEYIDLQMYDVATPDGQDLVTQYGYFYKVDVRGVPVAFIDDEVVFGYGNDKTTGKHILEIVESKILGSPSNTQVEGEENLEDSSIHVPLLGSVDVKTFSLPVLTLVIGLLDGFNPCAMWALLFLITLLLGMENRKRMLLLGALFILSSGLVYFFFMAAWLHFLTFVGMILIVRIIIGLVAVTVGGKNIKDFWEHRKSEGVVCEVSSKKSATKTFEWIKNIVYRRSLIWSIIGILLLGFFVNLVELACSAGFPAVYTQILSMSGISIWQKYSYMAGYIFFFMLDDMIVFVIAVLTLKSKVLGSKYAKYTNLVAGILIFILGILLIFQPEWLMFS